VHRDYFISAPIRVFVFIDRVKIISPGHLPNNLTVENIKAGNSKTRHTRECVAEVFGEAIDNPSSPAFSSLVYSGHPTSVLDLPSR
jgi:hypothetical protein